MYKIFLVEDEAVIRNGIKNSINWEKQGLEFAGEAGDGELAYPLIKKTQPDILITDIRMPFMDGLELARLVRKDMPRIRIIILSGYNDFDYAKTAIGLGVTDYLLKPVSAAQLLEAISRVTDQLEKEREQEEVLLMYRREMEENLALEQNKLFQSMVNGECPVQSLLDMAEKAQVDLSGLWHNFLLLKSQSVHHRDTEYSASVVEAQKRLKEIAERAGCSLFDRNPEGKVLLLGADNEEELKALEEEMRGQIESMYTAFPQIRYFGGFGMRVNRLSNLPESYEQASRAFAHRFFVNESMILTEAESHVHPVYEEQRAEEFDLSNVDPKMFDRGKLRDFLRTGDLDETGYFVEELFEELRTSALKSVLFRQYITMDSYFCVSDFLDSMELDRTGIEKPDVSGGAFSDENSAVSYITRIIKEAISRRDRSAGSRYRDVIREAMRYIEEHYADEDLSLNSLASHVNLSPNHLSMVFSQETGETFIRCLTDFRMNKARELLRCTSKKSSEISQDVGYRDPHYFSYLFKKTQGMTPTQYRGS